MHIDPDTAPGAAPVRAPDDYVVRALQLRAVQDDQRAADFVFSTATIDRYGERVEQSWQLERFAANPVALFAHDSRSLPVGQARDVGVVDGQLRGTIVFATAAANPLAENVWQSVRERTLRAVSVGFRPHSVRVEREDDRDVYVYSDNELLEISVVPIPANQEALVRLRSMACASSSVSSNTATVGRRGTIQDQPSPDDGATEESEMKIDETVQEMIDAANGERDDAVARAVAIEAQNAALVAERDLALAELAALRETVVRSEVTALVGVRFSAAEVEDQIALALRDRPLFERLTAQRTPMTLLVRDPAGIGPNPEPRVVAAGDEHGEGFARLVNAAING